MDTVRLKPDRDHQAARAALAQGLQYLSAQQNADGSFETLAGPDDDLERTGTPDPSPFTTAMIASALRIVEDDGAAQIVDRAVESLLAERLSIGAWGFWSKQHPGFGFIPPDIDDTAYSAHVLSRAGIHTPASQALMLGNRDQSGLFYTWILPRRRHLTLPTTWPALAWILRSPLKLRRWMKAGHDRPDAAAVDLVVNINALAFLGDRPETADAAAWIIKVVSEGTEAVHDRHYQSALLTWYGILRCVESGVKSLNVLRPHISKHVMQFLPRDEHSRMPALQVGLAVSLAGTWITDPHCPEQAMQFLTETQRADGSWPAHPIYYGGFQRRRAWGSAALTTALCVEALARALRSSMEE